MSTDLFCNQEHLQTKQNKQMKKQTGSPRRCQGLIQMPRSPEAILTPGQGLGTRPLRVRPMLTFSMCFSSPSVSGPPCWVLGTQLCSRQTCQAWRSLGMLYRISDAQAPTPGSESLRWSPGCVLFRGSLGTSLGPECFWHLKTMALMENGLPEVQGP